MQNYTSLQVSDFHFPIFFHWQSNLGLNGSNMSDLNNIQEWSNSNTFYREHDNSGITLLSLGSLQTSQGKVLSISKEFWMAHMTWVGDSSLLCSCQGTHSTKTSPVVSCKLCPQTLELPQSLSKQDHGHGSHWSRAWSVGWWPWPCSVPTNLLRGHDHICTHRLWSWPAHRLPASPWICLITTDLSNVSALGWISAAVYGPALLPHWDSQDPALVTLTLARYFLWDQLPLLLPDSSAKAFILPKRHCRLEPGASFYPDVSIRWFQGCWWEGRSITKKTILWRELLLSVRLFHEQRISVSVIFLE